MVDPDDVWYHSCTPEVLERIIDEHLMDGHIVEEFLIVPSDRIEASEAQVPPRKG